MFRTVLASVVAISTVAASPALAAQPKADGASVIVHSNDLNLSSSVGAAALAKRIKVAVTKVCGSADLRDVAAWSHMTTCRNVAMSGSLRQVAMLTNNARVLAALQPRGRKTKV